jgi:hypothetical protein
MNTPILDNILNRLDKIESREPITIPSLSNLNVSGGRHRDFIIILREIVESIPKRLDQSLSDLIWWLETDYQGNGTFGVTGAFTDFCTGELAVNEVSEIWYESLHTSLAARFQAWALNEVLDPTDWEQCLKLAHEILQSYEDHLPPEIRATQPAVLAANIQELLALVIYLHENAISK